MSQLGFYEVELKSSQTEPYAWVVCRFRGVSKKKGKWEAKVMVNRKWAYRELFDSEEEAARAYDGAVWRLKPKEAKSYVNFKERPGQGSSKLAKAARMIERAQAK